jgi:hypothetical protein
MFNQQQPAITLRKKSKSLLECLALLRKSDRAASLIAECGMRRILALTPDEIEVLIHEDVRGLCSTSPFSARRIFGGGIG